jgi:hypothetical protein
MDDDKLIEKLEEGVREAEELLHRRKQALAALKGKSTTQSAKKAPRGLRAGSLPALAAAALKAAKAPLSLEELAEVLKKEPRDVSLALSRYVRNGKYFQVSDEGKYANR